MTKAVKSVEWYDGQYLRGTATAIHSQSVGALL